ncbi:hypothetical protein ACLKA7_015323 [Drosophila subpalustris]
MPGALAANFAAAPSAPSPSHPVLLRLDPFRSIFILLAGKQITAASLALQNLAWKFNTFGFKSQDMLLALRCQAASALRDWLLPVASRQ